MKRRKVICVPGLVNRFLALVIRSRVAQPFIRGTYGNRLKAGDWRN
ncbi:MAG: hypothetical protein GXX96_19795 [Planctomycetaceae bacterium]|nr:hypothetical protein [Planctomycetaceae bacterium]